MDKESVEYRLAKHGIGQIPIDGLYRLKDWLDHGMPILLTGAIVDGDGFS